ncbi:MAG: isoprenylcysteine carboxylmethyltransferase family protein [Chloroflexi bacterium]|nr:isoprenylcysteine carboxylmethyltransferase family protein [Chloroflexota bacterium]
MRLLLHTAVFVAIAPGALVVGVPALIVWLSGASAGGPALIAAAAVVLAAGLAIFAWCVSDFVTRGKGTPDPNRPPTELVVHGLFRIVRNPMYTGVVTMIAGEALLFLSPWLLAWAVAVLLVFHLRVVIYEEPTLARTFGASWDAYRARVPRWLPRVHRT